MRVILVRSMTILGMELMLALSATTARGQGNAWSNPQSGSFEWATAANWSLGVVPSSSQSGTFLTNSASAPPFGHFRTVTIDSSTVSGFPGSMTISNLTISGPGSLSAETFNTLLVTNAGSVTPFRIIRNLMVLGRGSVAVTNSVLRVDGVNSGFLQDDG